MLKVVKWAARAPGIATVEEWQKWAESPSFESNSLPVKRQLVPPAVSRRASRVSQYALEAALELTGDELPEYGVFASRHGEIGYTVELLQTIANKESLSAFAFSQSVHNTAAGLFTIVKKSHMKTTSICAGTLTFDMALLEASIYLKSNPGHRVMLVCFDQALPDFYQKEITEHTVDYSVALLLEWDDSCSVVLKKNDPVLLNWPRALAFLHTTIVSGSNRLNFSPQDNRWTVCESEI